MNTQPEEMLDFCQKRIEPPGCSQGPTDSQSELAQSSDLRGEIYESVSNATLRKVVAYFTNCYASPDQVSVGPSTRHYYHIDALAGGGWDVEVVTASRSTISEISVSPGSTPEGIKVNLVPVAGVGSDSILCRMAHHLWFFFGGLRVLMNMRRPILVIASIPSLLIGWQGYMASRLYGARLLIDVRDLWSESLATTSLGRLPLFLSINQSIEKWLYKNADVVTCTSEAQAEEVREVVADQVPVYVVPNGLDPEIKAESVQAHPLIHEIRRRYQRIGLYAGKHSKYAALDTLLSAAKRLQKDDFAILLVGGGYSKAGLVKRAKEEGLQNVFFHDPVPKQEISSFLIGADIFFINYSPSKAWRKVLPNKIFDYMYWNRPIVAAVEPGEITRVLSESGAGIGVPPGDSESIVRAVRHYLNTNTGWTTARAYVVRRYDRRSAVESFVKACGEALKRKAV